jgi:hypothetical protein
MFAKTVLALATTAVLAEQILAHNVHHRHMHQLARKDRVFIETDIVVVTEWKTVTVYDDEVATASASKLFAASRPHRSEKYAKLGSASATASVASASISSAAAAVPETPAAPKPTTLITQAKPEPATTAAPAVEQPPPAAKPAIPEPAAPSAVAPAPVAANPPSTGTTGGKRGLAYNDAGLLNAFFSGGSSCTKCGWAYNWDSTDGGLSHSGLDFAPMLWGTNPVHTSRWNKNADAMLAKGSTHLLSFNEPDFPAQANLSPDDAANGHIKYLNPYSGKAKIGAPAITNSNIPGQGLDWLRSFISACDAKGCAIDFCVTHWYSPTDAASTLFDHLEQVHNICHGKPVWLTEFAPFGSDDQIASFLSTNLPKLDGLPYLERYSYFMAGTGSLLSSSNSLSSYGKVYASA